MAPGGGAEQRPVTEQAKGILGALAAAVVSAATGASIDDRARLLIALEWEGLMEPDTAAGLTMVG